MTRLGVMVAVAVGTAAPGCGEILEVPVATTEEPTTAAASASSTGEPEGSGTTSGSTGIEKPPDIDDASTSSPSDDGVADTTGGTPEPLPFCSGLADVPSIPENDTELEVPIEVAPQAGVSMIRVGIRISHPRVSDLRMELRAPDGTATPLLANPRCEGANVDAMFQDGAVQLANDQCLAMEVAAIRGPVAALDSLDALLHTPVGGTWTLVLSDTAPDEGTAGYLDQACVVLVVEGD